MPSDDHSNTDPQHTTPGNRDRALIDKLKHALRPADARTPPPRADTTHDGRHGGIGVVMEPGKRDPHDDASPGGEPFGMQQQPHHARRGSAGSILERLYHRNTEGEHSAVIGQGEQRYRDASADKPVEESRVLGNFYQTIRDDFGG